jgi:hypothetical protein
MLNIEKKHFDINEKIILIKGKFTAGIAPNKFILINILLYIFRYKILLLIITKYL